MSLRSSGFFTAVALTLLLGSTAGAGTFVPLGSSQGMNDNIVDVEVLSDAPDAIIIEYELQGFGLAPVTIDGEAWQAVTLGEESLMLDAGAPELPNIARSVIIPDAAAMTVRVVSSSFQEFENIDVVPSKGNLPRTIDPNQVPYEFGPIYSGDEWYPADLATHRDPYILRDVRGMVVLINPFQYHPGRHVLRVYDHVVVEVVPVGLGQTNVMDRQGLPESMDPEFAKIYEDHFINTGPMRYAPIPEVGEMLVIAYDSFVPNMQPFIDWKNQMGIKTTLVAKSDVGSSATEFQTYIQLVYDTTNLAFVLLVGDASQIPSLTNSGAPADPRYALVAGSDSYPDIFIGRLSAETPAQVDLQVQKFIEYEKLPAEGGAWYHKGVGIGSGEGAGVGDDGEADWEHMENIRLDLLDFTYTQVDSIYAHAPWQANATMVANAVNDGRSIINYCGHGGSTYWVTTGFGDSHVDQLVNDNMLPWIISVACVNGKFHTGTCFAESWLRASNGAAPTGAVGMYASTVNMSWAPPMAAQDETVDLLVAEEKRTYGALCFSGSCQMMDEYGSAGQSEFKNWHVFGDPSLRVRSDMPSLLAVEHEDVIDPQATSFTVTVPGIEGVLCGLSFDGQFLGSAFTDVSGLAEITVVGAIPEEDSITLTVTYFNSMPYFAQIQVGERLIPVVATDPESFNVYLPLEQVTTETLYISNTGMPGSLLEYTLSVEYGLEPTSPYGWLLVSPPSGQVPFGETDEIEVTFDSHGLSDGIYQAEIMVSSNGGRASIAAVLYAGEYQDVTSRDAATLVLAPASPNPFGGATTIAFALPEAKATRLGVYDMGGRLVRTLVSGVQVAGPHHVVWDGRDELGQDTPGGVYFYRLDAEDFSLSSKVILLR